MKIVASWGTRVGNGSLVWIRTVLGFTTSTRLIGFSQVATRRFALGSRIRSRLYLTAEASNGSPLANVTPGRRRNSHVVSFRVFQLVASQGANSPAGSRRVSAS